MVFISYARADAAAVLPLVRKLNSLGVPTWLDQANIAAGTNWDGAIDQALRACSHVVVFLSPRSVKSENVLDELMFARQAKKQLVPIVLEACDMPYWLQRVQATAGPSIDDAVLERLAAILPSAELPLHPTKVKPRVAVTTTLQGRTLYLDSSASGELYKSFDHAVLVGTNPTEGCGTRVQMMPGAEPVAALGSHYAAGAAVAYLFDLGYAEFLPIRMAVSGVLVEFLFQDGDRLVSGRATPIARVRVARAVKAKFR